MHLNFSFFILCHSEAGGIAHEHHSNSPFASFVIPTVGGIAYEHHSNSPFASFVIPTQEQSHSQIILFLSFRRQEESHSQIIKFLSFQKNSKRTQKHSKMDYFSKKVVYLFGFGLVISVKITGVELVLMSLA